MFELAVSNNPRLSTIQPDDPDGLSQRDTRREPLSTGEVTPQSVCENASSDNCTRCDTDALCFHLRLSKMTFHENLVYEDAWAKDLSP